MMGGRDQKDDNNVMIGYGEKERVKKNKLI